MRQPAFIVATLTGSLLFGASVAGALRAPGIGVSLDAAPQAMPASHVVRTPSVPARMQSAALAAAIEGQFPGHAVDVVLDASTLPEDERMDDGQAQQELQALARVRIDGSAPMLVRASALYDRGTRSVDVPSLWFEGTGAQPAPDAVRRDLVAAAARRLAAEFAGQPVDLTLADADTVAVGGRYLRLVARGTADFGAEGHAATTIEALYDPRNGEWLRLDYALGADPTQPGGDGIAYAGP
jgi:hypothetical protein